MAWKPWVYRRIVRWTPTTICKPFTPTFMLPAMWRGPYQFTHTASHQAWYATVNALFGDLKMFKTDYRVIPWVTFVDPEVARVGPQ